MRVHVDRHGVVHLATFLGEQYVLGGQARASVYSTYCGDKLVETEVAVGRRVTCLACLASRDA